MRQDTFITKMEELQAWFELNNAGKEPMPYFTLHRGFQAKPDCIIYRNTEISDAEKAWETLEEVIQAHADGGGSFRVYITTKPGFNVGMTTLLKLSSPHGAQVAGIAGVGGAGTFGIYGSAKEMIEAEIERRMEVYEMRRELEDLKAGQASVSGIEQFKQLLEYPAVNSLVQMLGMKVMGMAPVQQTHTPPPVPTANASTDYVSGHEHEGFDYDVVEPALAKMQRVFPDVEMTLDKLADWIVKNPDQAKMIFGNLNQPAA